MAATYELIQLLGQETVTDLQAAFGPRNMYIPACVDPAHEIAQVIGEDKMTDLCLEHGGTTIWIGTGYRNRRRNQEILRLVLAEAPPETIAKRYGITARYVMILAAPHRGPRAGIRARWRLWQTQGTENEPA